MKNNKIKISVVIPCYNSSKYIIETLDSITKQSIIDYVEIIVVNDGSTDNSKEIVEKFIEENQSINISLINQENKGPSIARNFGADHAKGEYLVFIDSDDKIHPKYLEKCIEILKNNPKIEIVYSNAEYFDAKKGKWKLPKFELKSFLIQNSIPIFCVMRTETFRKIKGFDGNLKFFEDWELWIRYSKQFKNFIYKIPETLFYYRKRTEKNSLINKNDKNLDRKNRISEKSLVYIYNIHYEFYLENGLGLETIFNAYRYKEKYYSVWYRRIFYYLKNENK